MVMLREGEDSVVTCGKTMLLVDDDRMLREALAEHFRLHEGFVAEEAGTGGDALNRTKSCHYGIILLNLNLPDMDGREVCRLLRRRDVTSPIILLTAADSPADVILGLDAGANDYVTKPFRLHILAARMRAQMRAYVDASDAVFSVGPYTFRPGDKLLVDRTTKARKSLTDKETALLRFLCGSGENPVGRKVLLTEVWKYNPEVVTHTLESHIYRLRRKIEDDPANPKILVSETNGYRLIR